MALTASRCRHATTLHKNQLNGKVADWMTNLGSAIQKKVFQVNKTIQK